MNLELKSEVLAKSISIENQLSQILRVLLDIEKSDSKVLGHRGTALSFKTKADLLRDLDKISKQTYNDLNLFMAIRNQFIHNIDTNSFETVIDRTESKKRIIEIFNESGNHSTLEMENKYSIGFNMLSSKLLNQLQVTETDIINQKVAALKEKIAAIEQIKAAEILDLNMKFMSDAIDEATELFGNRFQETFSYEGDIGMSIRSGIQGIIKKKWDDELAKRNER